jgi:acyl dehydratase
MSDLSEPTETVFRVKPGDAVSFSKTIGESDVYLFAGITGDFAYNHVNEERMRKTPYGRRIAHGALLVGFMSTCSTRLVDTYTDTSDGFTPVSLGYDGMRFLKPVFIGDTITVSYRIAAIDPERQRSTSEITIVNQDGETVTVARHILKWVRNDPSPARS